MYLEGGDWSGGRFGYCLRGLKVTCKNVQVNHGPHHFENPCHDKVSVWGFWKTSICLYKWIFLFCFVRFGLVWFLVRTVEELCLPQELKGAFLKWPERFCVRSTVRSLGQQRELWNRLRVKTARICVQKSPFYGRLYSRSRPLFIFRSILRNHSNTGAMSLFYLGRGLDTSYLEKFK